MKSLPSDWPQPKYWFGDRLCLTEYSSDVVVVWRSGFVIGITYGVTGYTYSLQWDDCFFDTFAYAEHELIDEEELA